MRRSKRRAKLVRRRLKAVGRYGGILRNPRYFDGYQTHLKWAMHRTGQIRSQWATIESVCTDWASRARLGRLLSRLSGHDRGAFESALAELELATLLIRAGCRVRFLPESQARTADLECHVGEDRFFVEVTALVSSAGTHRSGPGAKPIPAEQEEERHVLIDRIVARVLQKAKQLEEYSAPVLLAITVPQRGPAAGKPRDRQDELDLKRLAGTITLMLLSVCRVSGVLLSLWDVEPAAARSGVRLFNVHVVERSPYQTAYPRIRMLITNPAAGFPFTAQEAEALKGLL